MSLQGDILAALDSIKTSLPDVVVPVVFKGDSFTALSTAMQMALLNPSPFSDSEASATIIAKSTDFATEPQYGDVINISGKDRLIKSVGLDPVGASYKIEHTAHYGDWADITDGNDPSAVYVRIRVRVLDAEDGQFMQIAEFNASADKYIALIRASEWPELNAPGAGYVLAFDADQRAPLYVSNVIKQQGDYRLSCREAANG